MRTLVLVLAVWRLTSLLHRERGPWDMLVRLRVWAGVRFAEDSMPYATTNLAEGLLCFWCCSVWASAGLTLLAVVLQQATLAEAPWLWLAGSAGAIIVDEVLP